MDEVRNEEIWREMARNEDFWRSTMFLSQTHDFWQQYHCPDDFDLEGIEDWNGWDYEDDMAYDGMNRNRAQAVGEFVSHFDETAEQALQYICPNGTCIQNTIEQMNLQDMADYLYFNNQDAREIVDQALDDITAVSGADMARADAIAGMDSAAQASDAITGAVQTQVDQSGEDDIWSWLGSLLGM